MIRSAQFVADEKKSAAALATTLHTGSDPRRRGSVRQLLLILRLGFGMERDHTRRRRHRCIRGIFADEHAVAVAAVVCPVLAAWRTLSGEQPIPKRPTTEAMSSERITCLPSQADPERAQEPLS